MPRPQVNQYPTVAEFQTAYASWHVKLHEFAPKVEARVQEQYGLWDGGDLCYNLQDQGVIPEDASVDQAARIVAQHLQQA